MNTEINSNLPKYSAKLSQGEGAYGKYANAYCACAKIGRIYIFTIQANAEGTVDLPVSDFGDAAADFSTSSLMATSAILFKGKALDNTTDVYIRGYPNSGSFQLSVGAPCGFYAHFAVPGRV